VIRRDFDYDPPLADPQGTVRDLLYRQLGSGSYQWEHVKYDPFGAPEASETFDLANLGQSGQEYDVETGLYHTGGRYYEPTSARMFTEGSPNPGDTNAYRYAGNSPTNTALVSHGSTSFLREFARDYGYYLNPLNNDAGEGWLFGTGKVLGWSMFVVGSGGLGIIKGAGVIGALGGGSMLAYGGSTAGTVGGMTAMAMQVYAGNPNAGLHEYGFAMGLGGLFGGWMPGAGLTSLGGTLAGGGIEYAAGGNFYGQGMQWGGLAGEIIGGGLHGGMRAMLTEAAFATAGVGVGYGLYGTGEGALLGANLGGAVGGIVDVAYGVYRRLGAPNSAVAAMQASRRSGKLYTKFDQLERRLGGWGIRLERNADEALDAIGEARGVNIGALFAGNVNGTGVLRVRANATRYEVLHELGHVLDFRRNPTQWVRPASNEGLSLLLREQAVYNRLRNSRSWYLFNFQERLHAYRYIESLGGNPQINLETGRTISRYSF